MAARRLILVLAIAAAYWPALSSPFLFDDQTGIIDNTTIRSLSPGLVLSPPRDTPVAGRPIVNLTLALNYAADQLNPRGYRLVNLGIHAAAALLLFATIRRALLLPNVPKAFAAHAVDLAFAVALLWALHPLNSEAVNYVIERTESLMGLFYLLTVYCSLRGWTAGAIAACAAGMLCKESMVTAPLMVLLLDRVLRFGSWRESFHERGRLYGGLFAAWLVLAAMLAGTPRTSAGFGSGITPWSYLLNQAQMIGQYLKLTIWPRALVLDYGVPQPLALGDVWLPGLFVVALLALTIVAVIRWPRVALAGLWFFITLSPTSSLVPIATEVGAERRMYLPLVAVTTLAALALWRFIGNSRLRQMIVAVVAVAMIAGVVARGREYQSRLRMAETIVERWPNGRGHFLLGSLLLEAGRHQEGMAQMRESARDYSGALYAIATEQLAAGQNSDAVATLRRFLEALPNHASAVPARDMLARAFALQGDTPGAEREARLLVQLAPDYASGHDLLGRLLAWRGDFAGAAAEFQRVVQLQPGNADAQRNLQAVQRLASGDR